MNNSDYPQHTPELKRLFDEMTVTREALSKVAGKYHNSAFRSPEYKAADAAYRAYWAEVDADKLNHTDSSAD